MKARFSGGPLHDRVQELPIHGDGLPQAEIKCEVRDAGVLSWTEPLDDQLQAGVLVREVTYVRVVNPLDEGPLVLYIASELEDWDSHPDDD